MTKKEAALRQINAAIQHFELKEYECAITLAGAAEGQMEGAEGSRHLFEELKVRVPPEFKNENEWVSWLNSTRDWLKHETPQLGDEWEINDYEAAIMILRAVTKFQWTYKQGTKQMEIFLEHWRKGEYSPPSAKH
jgi:hypothetical protein